MLEARLITTYTEFLRLRAEWNELAEATDKQSVFLRHEWFDAAWEWRRADCELLIACVSRGATPIGIWPLVSRRYRIRGLPIRGIEFLSVPDSQECTILSAKQDLDDVADALGELLQKERVPWDFFHLGKIREDSPALPGLRRAMNQIGVGWRETDDGENFGIELDGDWQSYYGRRSRRLKKGNNLIVNKLKRAGKDAEVHCHTADDESGLPMAEVLGFVQSLSASSWKAADGTTLEKDDPGRFIARLTEHAVANSWLRVWLLTVDGAPAAMEYHLQYNGVVSALRADYDVRYRQESPGTLLNWRVIERLFDTNAMRYFMGPGSNTYKLRWAETRTSLIGLEAYGKSLRGRLLAFVDLVGKPIGRRVLQAFKRRSEKPK